MKKAVKKIKKDFERDISIIVNEIEPRVDEVCEKFREGLYNEATMFAFWIGLRGDLNSALKEIEKRKNASNKRHNANK
jgi:hypothetical protein